jgi:hypothetical protein
MKRIIASILFTLLLAGNAAAATTAQQVEFLLAGYRHPTTDVVLAGGKVKTYLNGTSTLSNLWTDRDKGGSATNPIILDSAGKAEVYGDNIYKFEIYDSDDVLIETLTGLLYTTNGLLLLDEDDMASDSDQAAATQQSIVAYLKTDPALATPGDIGGTTPNDITGTTVTATVGFVGDFSGDVTGDLVGDVYAANGTSKVLENGTNGTDATFTGDVSGNAGTVTNGVYTTDNLSALSATTSAQLAGVITNETGTSLLVYNTSPSLTSPAINTSVTGSAFLDDDTFATASATTFASSESIKAYVDNTVTATGKTIQVVNVQDGAVATGTGVIPCDDTIPQNTEGDEYMTLAITPTNATNKLVIETVAYINSTDALATQTVSALFQDSTASALAAQFCARNASASSVSICSIRHYMTAGTTSSTTFKIRASGCGAGTTTFNGSAGSRQLGGVSASSITITEVGT